MKNRDILTTLEPVVAAFEKLKIDYYVGGSIASSAYGIARATLDIDLISNLKPSQVKAFVRSLESVYYIDEKMILTAIRRAACFNIIHLETLIKIDVFILKDSAYHREAFQRRKKELLEEENDNSQYFLATPEDIILNKLEWFKMGGYVSERQWFDVLGVMKVQGDLLDRAYLNHWAAELNIIDLLHKALIESTTE